ncbi:DUF3159 domain-containing protein [Nonomuraea soli]|uniref:DUF3159 domain-containing protein n=1 Tax=Nonomuraea soli TaxID=1032476 RepID=A0A7W0CNG6_9ACTN|nr:DUF3159 domain-containing protein [Nonomuraea soli]MBA2894433.1 hypothetical protein [Nonomuraea soli]
MSETRAEANAPGDEERVSPAAEPEAVETVEAAVRRQLGKALGGKRGVIEAAIPTLTFTLAWLITEELKLSLYISGAVVVALLIVRVLQRSTVQFVLNSAFGIAIAAVFVAKSGNAADIALPGLIINAAYAVVMFISIITRWPVMGFLVGTMAEDPLSWRKDPGIVKLCTKLTWLLMAPNLVRLAVQVPLYAAIKMGLLSQEWVVAQLGLKYAMGWPLQIASFAAMGWVLARGRTPVSSPAA